MWFDEIPVAKLEKMWRRFFNTLISWRFVFRAAHSKENVVRSPPDNEEKQNVLEF